VARAIVCPCLVMVGAEDQVTPAAEMRDLAGSIRGARFLEIPAVGHLSQLEAPDIFNQAVLEFMASLPGPRSTGGGSPPPGDRQRHA
jgi:pimeloyl-ACP methyl ester carboxylesterase